MADAHVRTAEQITPFVGRRQELAKLKDLLGDANIHLVTILGLSGIGKTRLAIEAAHQVTELFAEGTYFISLVSAATRDHIIEHILETLALDLSYSQQLPTVLGNKKILLILDNFDHLLGHSGWVLEILETCPNVSILVTSGEPLNLRGEWVLQLGGMDYPAQTSVEAAVADYDAIELFALRAQQIQHNFSLTHEYAHVVRICQLVEGMPLAIELAAAWMRTLSPLEIAAEIQHNLNILQTKYRDVEPRHRSIEATFDQSWKLLMPDEQTVFKRLTIFRGGFSREAAESVADIDLETLDALIDKSLVRRQRDNRYNIHELLRQYGEIRLEQNSQEHQQVLKQCAIHYSHFIQHQAQYFHMMVGTINLEQLWQEINNIQRALNYLLLQQRVAEISESLMALNYLYQQAGWLREGQQDFARIVDYLRQCGPCVKRDLALARALISQAYWLHCLDRHDEALERLDESLSLLDESSKSSADIGLALLYRARIVRALKRTHQTAVDLSQAKNHFEAADWAYGVWIVQIYTAEMHYEQRAFERARDLLQQALKISQLRDQVPGQIFILGYMALVEAQINALEAARGHLLDSLRLCELHQVVYPIPIIMVAAAALLERCGEWDASARLAKGAWGHPASDFQVKRYAGTVLEHSAKHMDVHPITDILPVGSRYAIETITPEELLSLQQLLNTVQSSERPIFTEREQEVLRLLVNGSTNSQIGRVLNIAEGTVKRYTHHIFTKLGAQNRAEAAHRANEWNLI